MPCFIANKKFTKLHAVECAIINFVAKPRHFLIPTKRETWKLLHTHFSIVSDSRQRQSQLTRQALSSCSVITKSLWSPTEKQFVSFWTSFLVHLSSSIWTSMWVTAWAPTSWISQMSTFILREKMSLVWFQAILLPIRQEGEEFQRNLSYRRPS